VAYFPILCWPGISSPFWAFVPVQIYRRLISQLSKLGMFKHLCCATLLHASLAFATTVQQSNFAVWYGVPVQFYVMVGYVAPVFLL
jgi:hypothetical protein